MEFSREMWTLIAIACFIALYVLRRGWRRALLGRPNLLLTELRNLFPVIENVVVVDNPARQVPGMRKLQLRDDRASVIYTWSDHAETLDVSVPGTFGLILTWRDGKVSRLSRIGGREIVFPSLSSPEQRSVEALLGKVRAIVAASKK